ncbi:SRPBCC domain-containing protein [Paenibacillus alvei]|uniref:SRPBCC domain-containing protein n=1 Tax=Paenibacillus alvei TaxID=44250 RepID=A0ABT4H2H0_PAEAL|nr:SRPBCC domain-containing protein [Paenibacillus alvei]EJW19270.1 activator of Hsp90 ATPase 1 family protein [Paenibacillus alvei DSM 29]MCY9543182.1 SRPBCC domain-containing protein [Paenibacillus alvei]MCY9704860.1 SRPBCC domain-containing protein [Paenibacillus alvei]MCY9735863.1 SRPBCC domain-containing protein [Paenibacillus alvei]MCY9756774.1 SRPBCC domain-containing protein [Paenibacillus alvei]
MISKRSTSNKIVGLTASMGYQVGVRRTQLISPERAWAYLTSAEGLKLWIGTVSPLSFSVGETFRSAEGISGQFRVVKPYQQLRLRWSKKEWVEPSTLQIRLLSNQPDKTTISFHQENLDHPVTREQMKLHWEDVLAAIREQTSQS